MKDFLNGRLDNYVANKWTSRVGQISNSEVELKMMLQKLSRLASEIKKSVTFLDASSVDVINSIEQSMDKVERKMLFLEDSVDFMLNSKVSMQQGSKYDMSQINLSSGEYNNSTYSITKRGLCLSSEEQRSVR